MAAPPLITLLTDFGDQDTYVGQMRGVIAGIVRAANVVDLTHAIAPQDVLQGAIVWADAIAAFPPGTIHVGVVDPGVGTNRLAIAAEIGPWRFVAPDNGLLTAVRRRWPTQAVVELNRPEWHRSPRSATFHGRDVFAPVAAYWARDIAMTSLGTPLETPLVEVELPVVAIGEHEVHGVILWPDRFGNLLTNITTADVPSDIPPERVRVTVADRTIAGIARCYGDCPVGTLNALWDSSDRLEVAVSGGSAAELLKLQRGDEIRVHWDASGEPGA